MRHEGIWALYAATSKAQAVIWESKRGVHQKITVVVKEAGPSLKKSVEADESLGSC
jgi:hypothetical protein